MKVKNIKNIQVFVIIGLIIALIASTYSFFALQKTADDFAKVEKRRIDSLLIAYELRQSSTDLTDMARSYVASGGKKVYKEIFDNVVAIRNGEAEVPEEYHRAYWDFVLAGNEAPRPSSGMKRSLVKRAGDAGMTPQEIELINHSYEVSNTLIEKENEAFNALKGVYKDNTGSYTRDAETNQAYALSILYSDEYYAEKETIMQVIDDFFILMEKNVHAEEKTLLERQRFLDILFAIAAVATLALIIIAVSLNSLQNRQTLDERQIAQEKAENENDRLNDSVINILQAVSSLSDKDLTVRAPVTEDIIGTVADSINLLAEETSNVLKGVTDIAGQVSTVSDSVHEQAEQVSETAKEERNSVQAMIETLFDTTQTMNQVAALAEQSNESAAESTEITKSALETVNKTVDGMESIRETISETEKRIKRLGERSQEISGIVNLINTISERTHVLALNASMQAAVAGEAGRGFAVVAEEVQQLAESSRNATEQISTLVNNIQIETNETINTVNRTIGQVVEGSEQAQQAGEQMKETQRITSELVSRVQNIALASLKQKDMSAQLLENVQAIGDSTEKTASQIDAQNAGTEELQKAAKMLVDSVKVFKLPA